jgi:serine/threonine protein kinase
VIKLYVRRSSDFDLKRHERALDELNAKLPLSQCPSILNLCKIEVTDRAVYLGRQYFGHNLVDRFHVHPSLTDIERCWFTWQMLHAVHQLHSHGVRHGDIKTENFLLTSWNWLFLVDLAFYKPTFLPNDNPADYHFYFENSGSIGSSGMITQNARRRCYLAPERFYSQITDRKFLEPSVAGGSGGSDGQVSEAMDVFSTGCVIAELFLNGEQVLFDLPLLLAYREGEYDPTPTLNKIPNPSARALVRHMIQRDPAKRLSMKAYMKAWSTPGGMEGMMKNLPASTVGEGQNARMGGGGGGGVQPLSPAPSSTTIASSSLHPSPPLFPAYFPYLYRFFAKLLTPELADPDIKIQALKTHRETIVREVLGTEYLKQQQAAQAPIGNLLPVMPTKKPADPSSTPQAPASAPTASVAPAPQGQNLLHEMSSFGSTLAKNTAGLKGVEELRKDTAAAQAAQAQAAQSGATKSTLTAPSPSKPQPSASPMLSPSAAPSAATLLDLASAAVGPSSTPLLSPAMGTANTTGGASDMDSLALGPPAITADYHGNGLTMISSIVCSCLQNVRYPITKLTALELLADFGAFVDDEVRLGRLVPYAVALLTDPNSMVRSTACHILTKLLSQVNTINSNSGSDAHLRRGESLFVEYIYPSLSRFPNDPEEIVRLAYAQCIAELATSSKRFLDLAQQARQLTAKQVVAAAGGGNQVTSPSSSPHALLSIVAVDSQYTQDLSTLQDTVLRLIIEMLTAGGSKVKRALLADITSLCEFMGRRRVNNDLLPHLITVLNDRDWQLRSAFFEYIVGVSIFVGRLAFQNFVLPCIEQALFDVEEFVIQRAVHALTSLSQQGLFEKRTMLDVGKKVGPLLCHPSAWIRAETIKCIASMAEVLGPAKSLVFLTPILRPFLSATALPDLSVETLHQHLKPHLTREEFRLAVQPRPSKDAESTVLASTVATKPVPVASSGRTQAAPVPAAFGAESYLAPSRLMESVGGVAASWMDASPIQQNRSTTKGGSSQPSRTPVVTEEPASTSQSEVSLEDSTDSVTASGTVPLGSGFKDDPLLFPVMDAYLFRLSQAIQSKGLQASSVVDSAKMNSMDEDSMLIELQNLSLSQTLEEQLPLHQLDIEPTVPELASQAAHVAAASALDRAAQETFDSLGVAGVDVRVRPSARAAATVDPSLIPASSRGHNQTAGLVSPSVGTAGATAQGGHPIPLRESLALTPVYVVKALGVPLAPPALGSLRPEWTSHSSFYANHRVLSTSAESLAMAEQHDPKLWRPKGVLVATLTEHKHVRTMAVARDNLFLASGGNEGVVKIWDCARLKLTAHARSQLSYVQQGRITSLAVCDSSHAVASASSNGSLHVFKVEYATNDEGNTGAGNSHRYVGLSEVKRVDPDPVHGEGSILKVAHFNTLTESLLLYSTQKAVHGWDLRSKKECLDLRLEPSMGVLTAMDIGPSPYVCVTGTSRGFITVWDLRFQLPVQVWRHSAKTAITNLTSFDAPSILPREPTLPSNNGTLNPSNPSSSNPSGLSYPHPTKGPLFFAAAEGTNAVTGFDIFTGESRMMLRVLNPTGETGASSSASSTGGAPNTPGAANRKASTISSGGSSAPSQTVSVASYPNRTRQKVRVSPLSLPSLRSYIRTDYATGLPGSQSALSGQHPAYSSSSGFYHSLLGVTLDDSFLREFSTLGSPDSSSLSSSSGGGSSLVGPSSVHAFLVCKESFAITAGTDRKVRFWDMRDPADSYRSVQWRHSEDRGILSVRCADRLCCLLFLLV